MQKLGKFLKWIDENLLKIIITFFIFFIPLYPKLPLIDIEYTYIYIRFEDLFLALIYFVFLVQFLRKKVRFNWQFFFLFLFFWVSVFISFYLGFFVLKTIPVNYIGLLHSLRRIEYMGIFFVAYASVKNKKDFFYYLKLAIFIAFIVSVYGIGQKFFGWPAVQTMNPEYARGYLLFLTPEARISSTFSGHYDLASYLIFLMPIILSLFLFFRHHLRYFLAFVFALSSLILTASRISYIGYFMTVFPFLFFHKKWRLAFTVFILTIILTLANNNLTSRLKRTFQVKRILVDQKTGAVYIPQKITTKELPAGSFYIPLKNQNNTSNISNEDKYLQDYKKKLILEKEIQATKSGEKIDVASLEANIKPINTVVSDISFATRLQVEWPRALAAFKKSPLFGTGPSSLTEATDNDYLRWLGETGLMGTFLFLTIILKIAYEIFKKILNSNFEEKIILKGFLFGLTALMINASYIDVFEASKVAYTFWMITGIFIGFIGLHKNKKAYEK
jgi:hypothetical protein